MKVNKGEYELKVILSGDLLQVNNNQAEDNSSILKTHKILGINIIGSPGAGKTLLLERTIERLKGDAKVGVIEGDIATARDAMRIGAHGVPVIQLNTEGMCHLDARIVGRALSEMPLSDIDILFIENVGNLVCPALFHLGEDFKVAVLSVTEGSDKPHKYPQIFREARVVLINKVDLIDYTDFELNECKSELLEINSSLNIFTLSAKTGEGIDPWVEWLKGVMR